MSREIEATRAVLDRRLQQSREFFFSGATREARFRRKQLGKLLEAIKLREGRIIDALEADLGKCAFESYASEIGFLYEELRYIRRRLGRWSRPKRVPTPLVHFPSRSWIEPEPVGVALILSPWNYPFQLALVPLIGAIASGCTAILKPSEFAPASSAVIKELVSATFDPEYVDVVEGDDRVASTLVSLPFDKIFFTGSTAVGKKVMAAASDNLTPVVLELGGKSPAIVHDDAEIEIAARRIAWGKFLNAGQSCVAPDFVYVHDSIAEAFQSQLAASVRRFFGANPAESEDYGRIVDDRHFDRLRTLQERALSRDDTRLLFGGEADRSSRFIAPTAVELPDWDTPLMEEEIFGPILPVLRYTALDEVVRELQRRPNPLSLYIFSQSRPVQEWVTRAVPFGGGCINETNLHLASPYLPFGGTGSSGTGSCHGKASFDAFTHQKSILSHATWLDLPLKYPPYTKWAMTLVRKLMG